MPPKSDWLKKILFLYEIERTYNTSFQFVEITLLVHVFRRSLALSITLTIILNHDFYIIFLQLIFIWLDICQWSVTLKLILFAILEIKSWITLMSPPLNCVFISFIIVPDALEATIKKDIMYIIFKRHPFYLASYKAELCWGLPKLPNIISYLAPCINPPLAFRTPKSDKIFWEYSIFLSN